MFLGNFRSGRTIYILRAVHVSSVLTGICDCFSSVAKDSAHVLRYLWVTCVSSEDCLLSASSDWAVWFSSFLTYVLDINPVRCVDRKRFLPFYRLASSCFLCYAELFNLVRSYLPTVDITAFSENPACDCMEVFALCCPLTDSDLTLRSPISFQLSLYMTRD